MDEIVGGRVSGQRPTGEITRFKISVRKNGQHRGRRVNLAPDLHRRRDEKQKREQVGRTTPCAPVMGGRTSTGGQPLSRRKGGGIARPTGICDGCFHSFGGVTDSIITNLKTPHTTKTNGVC